VKRVIKFFIVILIITIISIGGIFIFKKIKGKEPKDKGYTENPISLNTFTTTVDGSGRIIPEKEMSIKAEFSSTILDVFVKNSDEVKKGQIIAQLDSKDAIKYFNETSLALENAKANLEKIKKPADANTISQAQLSVQKAKYDLDKLKDKQVDDKINAAKTLLDSKEDLNKTYSETQDSIDVTLSSLSLYDTNGILKQLKEALHVRDIAYTPIEDDNDTKKVDDSLIFDVEIPLYWRDVSYAANFDTSANQQKLIDFAKKSTYYFKKAESLYKDISTKRYDSSINLNNEEDLKKYIDSIAQLLDYTHSSIRETNKLYDFWIDYNVARKRSIDQNIMSIYNPKLKSITSSISGLETSVNSLISKIDAAKDKIKEKESAVKELEITQPIDLMSQENALKDAENKLKDLKNGADPLDVKPLELALKQAQENMVEATKKLQNSTILAPTDGVISELNIKTGDTISPNQILTKIVSGGKIGELLINEIDSTLVKAGQTVDITFDAFPDIFVQGDVIDIGTKADSASQQYYGSNVVNYSVRVNLNNLTDKRVRDGMTIMGKIQVENKENVLTAPTESVNEDADGKKFVEVLVNGKIEKVFVEIGSQNIFQTEIKSGLKEGDVVIIRTEATTDNSQMPGFNGASIINEAKG